MSKSSSTRVLTSILFVFSLSLFSCVTTEKIETGDAAFDVKRYILAAELYEKEFLKAEDEGDKAMLAYNIAESYRLANRTTSAAQWYQQAADLNYGPRALFFYATMLKTKEDYEQAIIYFQEYIDKVPGDRAKAEKEIKGCKDAMKWQAQESETTVSTLDGLNSVAADYFPTIYKDNMVFSSQRTSSSGKAIYEWTGENFSDLFISKIDDQGNLSVPTLFDKEGIINTEDHEGSACFSKDGKEIYFTRCFSGLNGDAFCKIYHSKSVDDGQWSKPKKVRFFTDSTNYGDPNLSPDGSRLYLSADYPGGYGGKDIYVSTKQGVKWGDPVNMGANINTSGDERFPFEHEDGSLYFSSNGHVGMGGLDVFRATSNSNTWRITNLRHPINSGGDDFSLVFSNEENTNPLIEVLGTGYFTSAREGGMGNDDIYKFKIVRPKHLSIMLEGTVVKKVFEDPTDPESTVIDRIPVADALIQLYLGDSLVATITTEEDGMFVIEDLEAEKEYLLRASKTGFFVKKEQFSTMGMLVGDFSLTRIIVVEIVEIPVEIMVINNIYYKYDSKYIRADARPALNILVSLLKENPTLIVEIGSHTDSRGTEEYNFTLSKGRAQSVVRYLINHGINKRRLTARGYGESLLTNRCSDDVDCTEEQHQKNRRTTFRVTGTDFDIESIVPDNITTDGRKPDKEDDKEN
ncbi:MAG: OmpA family protein [Bacteroidetes bacterium]|nr:OmpA family protein [Bacteroidota bacterium]